MGGSTTSQNSVFGACVGFSHQRHYYSLFAFGRNPDLLHFEVRNWFLTNGFAETWAHVLSEVNRYLDIFGLPIYCSRGTKTPWLFNGTAIHWCRDWYWNLSQIFWWASFFSSFGDHLKTNVGNPKENHRKNHQKWLVFQPSPTGRFMASPSTRWNPRNFGASDRTGYWVGRHCSSCWVNLQECNIPIHNYYHLKTYDTLM